MSHQCQAALFLWGRPDYLLLFNISSFFNYSYQTKIIKYQQGTHGTPRISNLCVEIDYFEMGNFHFWPNFQIPPDFKLQILEQIQIWTFLEFKGVQIFLENSDKFPKSPSSPDILEYESISTHSYSNIGSSFTSGKRDLVYFIPYKSWPLKYIAPTITSTPLYQTVQGVFQTEL
jgi:hypothetical protein